MTESGRGKRSDIQALRALAVALVVAFHIAPGFVPGGYVGVDVFFVISGFLITGALLREVERTGRVRLTEFWARRARRLLPASLTVLAVTLVAVVTWMPVTQWSAIGRHVLGSAFYIENWLLAADSVDYLAAENAATPVQHFWSLSVEEQFYIVWPLLILVVGLAVARRRRHIAVGMIGAVFVTSLAASWWMTGTDPAAAYFVTYTRAWEFAAGALLAALPGLRAAAPVRSMIAWSGIVAIVVSAFVLSAGTPFPGLVAVLPVAGAVAVMVADAPRARHSPRMVGDLAVVQRIGDTSYSVYLWHWPLIVILPYVWVDSSGVSQGIVALVLTIALGEASYRWIESPTRAHPALMRRSPAVSMIVAVAATVLVGGAAFALKSDADRRATEVELVAPEAPSVAACRGAQVVFAAGTCDESTTGPLVPTPLAAQADRPDTCMQTQDGAELRVCESATPIERATETVAVIGDSHSMHWVPAVRVVADAAHWHVVEILKGSCPFTAAERLTDPTMSQSCVAWNGEVQDYLAAHPEITRIFTSASAANPYVPIDDAPAAVEAAVEAAIADAPAERDVSRDEAVAGAVGFLQAWESVPANVTHLYALRDIARPQPDVVDCLAALSEPQLDADGGDCGIDPQQSLLVDPLAIAAEVTTDPRVEVIDLATALCGQGSCDPIVGATVVYRDGHHITQSFSLTLGPELGRRIGVEGIPAPDLSR